jgi:hypothetical protein
LEAIRARKYLILLVVLVLLMALQPLAHGRFVGLLLFELLGILVLLTVFLVIFQSRAQRLAALITAAVAITSDWGTYALKGDARTAVVLLYHGALALFLAFAVVVILSRIFRQPRIGMDHVIGGLCGYLLAGIAWSNLYLFLETAAPGSFSVQPAFSWQLAERNPRRSLFNFYSFVNLASLGSNDLVPVRPIASWLVALEAVFGQFYVAVVVALIVGLKLTQAARDRANPP